MSAGGKTGLPANEDRTAKRHVDEFLTDRKKDSRGNLRVLSAAAAPENAPRMDFGETHKGAAGVLAGPSRGMQFTGVAGGVPDRVSDRKFMEEGW